MSDKTEGLDVGERKSVKKQKTKAERRQLRSDESFRKILRMYEGRELLWGILEQAGVYNTTFNESAALSAFQEGMRQIGLQLIAKIDHVDQNAYATMRREWLKRKEDE